MCVCAVKLHRESGGERERESESEKERQKGGGKVLNQKEVIRRDLMMMMVMRASESTD